VSRQVVELLLAALGWVSAVASLGSIAFSMPEAALVFALGTGLAVGGLVGVNR
jgi:hypothetical protein